MKVGNLVITAIADGHNRSGLLQPLYDRYRRYTTVTTVTTVTERSQLVPALVPVVPALVPAGPSWSQLVPGAGPSLPLSLPQATKIFARNTHFASKSFVFARVVE